MNKVATPKIMLNDILQLTSEQIENSKIRFMVPSSSGDFNPNSEVENPKKQDEVNLTALVWNGEKISFKTGTIVVGFIRIGEDRWLMTGIVKVIHNNGKHKAASAEYLDKKFNFRLVVNFHKYFENGIVLARNFIDKLEVIEIWHPEKSLNDKSFPGYKNVFISYIDLKKKLEISDEWRAALKYRKGVYLIADKKTGKFYVGSAYGTNGILGRWETYITSGYDKNEVENGKYPNKELQKLVKKEGLSYIRENFQYSILETFTDDVSDKYIIGRESWWKKALLSREFGYNVK